LQFRKNFFKIKNFEHFSAFKKERKTSMGVAWLDILVFERKK